MIELLHQPAGEGFPGDYLYARLRGRKGQPLHVGDAKSDAWTVLMADYRSLYGAMQPAMRKRFASCFLFFELRTLQMSLRWIAGRQQSLLDRVFSNSLLCAALLNRLRQCSDGSAACRVIGEELAPAISAEALVERYDREGPGRAEEALALALLSALLGRKQPDSVQDYLQGLGDIRNLLAVARALRWEIEAPLLIDTASDLSNRLAAAREAGDRRRMQALVAEQAAGDAGDLALLEAVLLERFGARLRRRARDPLGPGVILSYIWQRYQEVRRVGVAAWSGETFTAWEEVA